MRHHNSVTSLQNQSAWFSNPYAQTWTKSKSNVSNKVILQRSEMIWVTKQMRKAVPFQSSVVKRRPTLLCSFLNIHHLEIWFHRQKVSRALVGTSYSHLFHSHHLPSRYKQTPLTPSRMFPCFPHTRLTPASRPLPMHPVAETRWGLSSVSANCASLLLLKLPGYELCVQCSGAELVSVTEVCGVCRLAGGDLTHCLQCLGRFHAHCHFPT